MLLLLQQLLAGKHKVVDVVHHRAVDLRKGLPAIMIAILAHKIKLYKNSLFILNRVYN